MTEEHLIELNKMQKDLGVHPILYRDLWVYAIVYTHNFPNQKLRDEYSYQIVKNALTKVDKKYIGREGNRDFTMRKYSKDLVKESMEELGIKEPTKTL